MREATASAPGKVNLLLRAGRPDADGFHPLVTVFECLDLRETVRVRTSRTPGIRVRTTVRRPDGSTDLQAGAELDALPTERHLAVRAARLLQRLAATGPWAQTSSGVSIEVDKRVPVAGGMAGGSADAAATLVACNELWGLGLDGERLQALGRTLGADVPACLVGGIALGTGRGDHMTLLRPGADAGPNGVTPMDEGGPVLPLTVEPGDPAGPTDGATPGEPTAPTEPADSSEPADPTDRGVPTPAPWSHHWVLAVADRGLSTPEVFAALDAAGGPGGRWAPLPDLGDDERARLTGPADQLAGALVNDLTEAALQLRPALAHTVEVAREVGALGVVLSGSGPTVAALARGAGHARALAEAWRGTPGVAEVLTTRGPAAGAHLEPHPGEGAGHAPREGKN